MCLPVVGSSPGRIGLRASEGHCGTESALLKLAARSTSSVETTPEAPEAFSKQIRSHRRRSLGIVCPAILAFAGPPGNLVFAVRVLNTEGGSHVRSA